MKRRLTLVEMLVVLSILTLLVFSLVTGIAAARRDYLQIDSVIWPVLSGWVTYPLHIWPRVEVDGDAVASALLCLAGLAISGHLLLRWLHAQMSADKPEAQRQPWSKRSTALLLSLFVVAFCVYLSLTVIIHQVGWLMSDRAPLRLAKPWQQPIEADLWIAGVNWQTVDPQWETYTRLRTEDRVHAILIHGADGKPYAMVTAPRDAAERSRVGIMVFSAEHKDGQSLPGERFPAILDEMQAAADAAAK